MRLSFDTITVQGALFPIDFLERISSGDSSVESLTPAAYHLEGSLRIGEAVSQSWKVMLGAFKTFRAAQQDSASERGTTETREKLLLPLFRELGYGRLQTSPTITAGGKDFRISHMWHHVPVHLVSWKVDLDKRSEFQGAKSASPHGMLQDFLNRSDDHLWGFLSNGLTLRLLRDNRSITKPASIDFDLEAMFEGEVYSDFVVLWLLCHQSRVEGANPAETILEQWLQSSVRHGIRALETLRKGVEKALLELGTGFLEEPANSALREKFQSGKLTAEQYYTVLLRLIYRFLFLFIAEDRNLLHPEETRTDSLKERELYQNYYSTARLRKIAERTRGTKHTDLWEQFIFVSNKLGSDEGCKELALPAWGGFLWDAEFLSPVISCRLSNRRLLQAVRCAAFTEEHGMLRAVDYKNMGAEELGSVYESLLEQHPKIDTAKPEFLLHTGAGNERKTTGSYYTPDSLVQQLLDSALEPALRRAASGAHPEQALLALKICDPAMGSGHFLLAAAHRIAKRLAEIRTAESEPSPKEIRHAVRDVISRCIYGVDINPTAVELCKFALWAESLESGKPLSFLDHHIKCGNSLLGAQSRNIAEGIPDTAFEPLGGDDRAFCTRIKKLNKREREGGERSLFDFYILDETAPLLAEAQGILNEEDDTQLTVKKKKSAYAKYVNDPAYRASRRTADAWCAAFVLRKRDNLPYITTEQLRQYTEGNQLPKALQDAIDAAAVQFRFFHWELEFPDVFPKETDAAHSGGFDAVLGNPPWERIKLQEKEWFESRDTGTAHARNKAERQRRIDTLKTEMPALYAAFLEASHTAEAESHFLRRSGSFPLCGRGDVNTYTVFTELFRTLVRAGGRTGIIVPSGIASDDTTKEFFADIVDSAELISLYDFENREKLFEDVDSRMKFSLLTIGKGREAGKAADLVFYLANTGELTEQDRHFTLTKEEFALINPNTKTCPIFRTKRDAEITKQIYRRVPILKSENPNTPDSGWDVRFNRMFDMSNDAHLFLPFEVYNECKNPEKFVPLYEAKMIHHYNHRFGTYEGITGRTGTNLPTPDENALSNPNYKISHYYYVERSEVERRIAAFDWKRNYLLGVRNIARATDERTMIACVIPLAGVGHSANLFFIQKDKLSLLYSLVGCFGTFVFDYVLRQKTGGTNMTQHLLKQLPVLPENTYTEEHKQYIRERVLELTYTSHGLEDFAADCGYTGAPFTWNEARRFQLRCELDALYFTLYGLSKDDAAYIMDTFPIVKRKDEAKYGEYRTKRIILELM